MNAVMNTIAAMNMSNVENAAEVAAQMLQSVANMKVGYNLVPGLGVGYASNEEDLEKMKTFVTGTVAMIYAQVEANKSEQQSAEQPLALAEPVVGEVLDEYDEEVIPEADIVQIVEE